MPRSESIATLGAARSRQLRQRLAQELADARRALGLSQREVARRIGVSPQTIGRIERGDATAMSLDLAARLAPAIGLQLAASLYPFGDGVRDSAHLRLLARFRARLHPSLGWRAEVPIPIAGDPRSGDGVIRGEAWDALVEAETRLGDIQLAERRASAKQRDLGADHLILVVADTWHNREVLRLHPEVRERFPIDPRTCLRRLGQGMDPGRDSLVVI